MLKKVNTRFISLLLAVVMMFMVFPVNKAYAATITVVPKNGLAIAQEKITVYYNATCLKEEVKGTIFANEFFTVLVGDSTSTVYYVQYSISDAPGYKQGFIKNTSRFEGYEYFTCAGQMIKNSTVYYGPDANKFNTVGSVYYDECVAVLNKDGSWYYIEYDTTNGRKRGYIPMSTVSCFHEEVLKNEHYKFDNIMPEPVKTSVTHDLYAGETTMHNKVGTIPAGSKVTVVNRFNFNGKTMWYIRCEDGGKYTSGYILNRLYL